MSNRPCPQVLGIDEHFFSKKQRYATTLVDLKNHKVFDVVLGRSEARLEGYLKQLPGREQVKVVVMDLSETYRRIVKRYFPNAQIVADRFHVVRLVNHHFLKLWQQQDPEGRKNRGLLGLMRRHHWNLSRRPAAATAVLSGAVSGAGGALPSQTQADAVIAAQNAEAKQSQPVRIPTPSTDPAVRTEPSGCTG